MLISRSETSGTYSLYFTFMDTCILFFSIATILTGVRSWTWRRTNLKPVSMSTPRSRTENVAWSRFLIHENLKKMWCDHGPRNTVFLFLISILSKLIIVIVISRITWSRLFFFSISICFEFLISVRRLFDKFLELCY